MTNAMPVYTIQEWLFTEAEGKYNIDLAESGVQHQYLNNLSYDKYQHMNYSLDSGSTKLRKEVASHYGSHIDNICITHGGQEALYLFYNSFLNKSDHVITFSPGWQQSWEVPKHLGCEVDIISLNSKNNFQIDLDNLNNYIKINTKLIILNYPNNPTGVNIERKILDKLINLCEDNNIFILNDEEYLINYSDSIVNKYAYSASVSSLSKIYGFPATRVGWLVGPQNIVADMVNYRRYITVCNSALCENLALDILKNKLKHIDRFNKLTIPGLEILKQWADDNKMVELIQPDSLPFAYVMLDSKVNSDDFCKKLLKEQGVLLMPSSVFNHQENAVRITFARDEKILKEGLRRIDACLSLYS